MKGILLLIFMVGGVFTLTQHEPEATTEVAPSSYPTPAARPVDFSKRYLIPDEPVKKSHTSIITTQEPLSPPLVSDIQSSTVSTTIVSEQPMIKIRVLSSLTNQPIPHVPIVTAYSTRVVTTDMSGFTELPLSYDDIYVPALHGFQGSETVDIATTAVNDMITFFLKPDLYVPDTLPAPIQPTPEALINPVPADTVRIQVIDKRTGKPLSRMTIAVANSSMHRVTNEYGYADLPLTAGNLYVPVAEQFYSSETFTSIGPNIQGVIVVALEPHI